VDDSGLVTIAAVGGDSMERARQMVQALTAEPVVGEIYEGPVKSTTPFGAFIEIMPGTEGLLHISEMQHGRTEKTEDVVKKGDRVRVKLIERDERGRLRLSRKALLPPPETPEGGSDNRGEGGNGRPAGEEGEGREPVERAADRAARGEGGERGERSGGGRGERPRRGGERSRRQ
jgi:polyribonucleotide nucleotidyltransferase